MTVCRSAPLDGLGAAPTLGRYDLRSRRTSIARNHTDCRTMRLLAMLASPQALGGERDTATRASFAPLDQRFILGGAGPGVRDAGLWRAMLLHPYGHRPASPADVMRRRPHMGIVSVVHHGRRIEMQDVDGPRPIGGYVASPVGDRARVRLAGVVVPSAHHAALQLRHTDHTSVLEGRRV